MGAEGAHIVMIALIATTITVEEVVILIIVEMTVTEAVEAAGADTGAAALTLAEVEGHQLNAPLALP